MNVTGGSLYVGGTVQSDGAGATTAGGIVNRGTGTTTYAINLSGGTLGANANWASSLNMTLGTAGGNITIKAADAGDVAHNIALSGVLSGAGGLTKTGTGTLTLSGANIYSGATLVSAGMLEASSLGAGNVEVAAGAILTLDLNTAIGSSALLTLDRTNSVANLNFVGTDTIGVLLVNGTFVSPGTYTATALNNLFSTQFIGTGSLQVTAVPEPSVYLLMGLGLVMAMVFRRRSAMKA